MIEKETIVYPWKPPVKKSAFERMAEMYEKFKGPEKMFLWDDLEDYAENGYIYISPTSMWLAKPCRDAEGDFWFVRAAVGDLIEMLRFMPAYLPRIKWCRRNDGRIRRYYTDRLLQIVTARMKKR